jgi:hypothetical protein
MEDIQTGNVTDCLYCKRSITEVIDPFSGVIDWSDNGDFGCGDNPINNDEGTGSHHPSTMFRQAGYRLSAEELLKILREREVNFTEQVVWNLADAATYTAEEAKVNGHTVTVCTYDEGVTGSAFFWNIDGKRGIHDGVWFDGWARTVRRAKHDAIQAAKEMS